MASRKWILALSMMAGVTAAASPAAGAERDLTAPTGTSETRYCMRVAAATGSLVEQVKCWTRDQWADQGVDVDLEWPEEGVRAIG